MEFPHVVDALRGMIRHKEPERISVLQANTREEFRELIASHGNMTLAATLRRDREPSGEYIHRTDFSGNNLRVHITFSEGYEEGTIIGDPDGPMDRAISRRQLFTAEMALALFLKSLPVGSRAPTAIYTPLVSEGGHMYGGEISQEDRERHLHYAIKHKLEPLTPIAMPD